MTEILQRRDDRTQSIVEGEGLSSSYIVATETSKTRSASTSAEVRTKRQQQDESESQHREPSILRRLAFKAWLAWSRVMNRLRLISDVCLDSDEITEELFDDDGDDSTRRKFSSFLRNSGKNGDNKVSNGQKRICRCGPDVSKDIINSDILSNNTTPQTIQASDLRSGTIEKDSSALDSSLNDVTTKGAKEDNSIDPSHVPFAGGEALWRAQNKEWLKPAREYSDIQGRVKLMKRQREHELRSHGMKRDYPIVYQNLVVQGRALKQPMNLKDLIKVLTTDWAYEGYISTSRGASVTNQRTH